MAIKTWSRSVLLAGLCALALPGLAAEGGGHDHQGPKHALSLDAGKKWATDEPLRQSMGRIREQVQKQLPAAHANRLADADAKALASLVRTEIAFMVDNCQLKGKADENLHVLISQMLAGADKIEAAKTRQSGVVAVVNALNEYPKYFEHKGWLPIAH